VKVPPPQSSPTRGEEAGSKTLPDYLRPGLKLVIIGINPGHYSAQTGRYYARPGNLFWWALSNSGLVDGPVTPESGPALWKQGIGFTDIVKRPTHSSGDLRHEEFDAGVQGLLKKIRRYQPETACFVGLLGATAFLGRAVEPGPLEERIGATRLFTLPSTSRRNAHYGRDTILGYFKQLAGFVKETSVLLPH
jgi:TDG/mug DNA glycosylase family protein